ncbi:SEC-C metal-binding domain-containing protein [Bacillus xiapuensis]|uniref:SEC-C metal-binding domain-containing protein n=1 Tax=Bacillus xiapuensis TaxID=2014075 RepID=UPI000C239558|nr:SEC-C metal-binding domain-containing protein [Bacillus xiapuensis]
MSVGRNEPCPCGSGKKYKKCCGKVEGSAIHGVMLEELESLQRGLIDYAMEHYSHAMKKQFQTLLHKYEVIRKDPQVFLVAFEIWFILTQPVKNGRTVLEEYVARRLPSIKRERTRNIFKMWPQARFLAGQLGEVRGNVYEVQDILSGEMVAVRSRQRVPVDHAFIIGGVLPFEQEYTFFMIDFHFEKDKADQMASWLLSQCEQAQEKEAQAYVANHFLFVLDGLFAIYHQEQEESLDYSELTWEKESQEKTAHTLLQFLQEEAVEEMHQQSAVLLWHLYCQKENPTIRKPEIYVGALYSLMQAYQIAGTDLTNAALAKRLSISAQSLSKRAKEMENILKSKLLEQGEKAGKR